MTYRPQIGIIQFTNSAYCVLDEYIAIHTCHTYIRCTPFLDICMKPARNDLFLRGSSHVLASIASSVDDESCLKPSKTLLS